jgi:hypothetical protein
MSKKEKIFEFNKKINALNPAPTETSPEYIYTNALIEDEYLRDVLMSITFRGPMSVEQLAEKIGKSIELFPLGKR